MPTTTCGLHFGFPLNQFRGANVGLPRYLMRIHPVASERDAENYVAKLAQFGARMDTAIAEVQRREAKGVIPPRFILDATIKHTRAAGAHVLLIRHPMTTKFKMKREHGPPEPYFE